MYLTDDPRPPLPEWITDAYAVVTANLPESEISDSQSQIPAISRDQAMTVLVTTDELALEPEDADHALTRLLDRGYFYAVGDELRVTSPSE